MASLVKASLPALLCACVIICASAAPASSASHKVSPRNTDINSEIKAKLQRIKDLLGEMKLDSGSDEADLQKFAEDRTSTSGVEEKDMRSLGGREGSWDNRDIIMPRQPQVKHEVFVPPKPTVSDERAAQILASALANLRLQAQVTDIDTDGESLSDRYNEQASDVTDTLEQSIARALGRLQQETESEDQQKSEDIVEPPSPSQYREEAIQMVESRLMRDMVLASRLGVSVEDLIRDMNQQEAREATLRKLDRGLSVLSQIQREE